MLVSLNVCKYILYTFCVVWGFESFNPPPVSNMIYFEYNIGIHFWRASVDGFELRLSINRPSTYTQCGVDV